MENQICLARDIMRHNVLTVHEATTINELISIFLQDTEMQDLIPVIGEDNKLLGVVTMGDILYKKLYPYGPQYIDVIDAGASYTGYGRYMASFQKQLNTYVADIMTRHVRCVTPNTSLESIMLLAVDSHIPNIPVVEKPNTLVGIITRRDILKALENSSKLSSVE
ncbi:MAG: HPP family protein [Phascolarctobacterium sp.]